MKQFDVYSAIVDDDEVILALFDPRYNTVMIVKPEITKDGEPKLKVLEPDGTERLFWLEKFGMITEEEFEAEAGKVEGETEKIKLFEKLKKDLGR